MASISLLQNFGNKGSFEIKPFGDNYHLIFMKVKVSNDNIATLDKKEIICTKKELKLISSSLQTFLNFKH